MADSPSLGPKGVHVADGTGKGITSTNSGGKQGLDVNVIAGGAGGGGTQYNDGSTPTPPIVVTAAGWSNGGQIAVVSDSNPMPIQTVADLPVIFGTKTDSTTHSTVSLTSGASATVIAAPSGLLVRRQFMVQNPNSTTVWLKFDGTAATANNGVQLNALESVFIQSTDYVPQQAITGIQTSGSTVSVLASYVHV